MQPLLLLLAICFLSFLVFGFLPVGVSSPYQSACGGLGHFDGITLHRPAPPAPHLAYGYDQGDMYVGAAAGAGAFIPNLDVDDDLAHTYTAEAEHYNDVVDGFSFEG